MKMINEDFIDYSPRSIQQDFQSSISQTPDHLIYYCDYARLCSLVMKKLYGASPLKTAQNNFQDTVLFLGNALEKWKSSLPQNKILQHDYCWAMSVSRDFSTRQQMDLRLKYYELRFAIYPK